MPMTSGGASDMGSFESGVGAAIRRSGNPASGKVGDAKLIRKFGDVPDDLSAFVKPD
jgi:hypothetical protein